MNTVDIARTDTDIDVSTPPGTQDTISLLRARITENDPQLVHHR